MGKINITQATAIQGEYVKYISKQQNDEQERSPICPQFKEQHWSQEAYPQQLINKMVLLSESALRAKA